MKLKDYLHFADISAVQFAKNTGISLPCLYAIMRGKNFLIYNAAKIVHETEGAVTYDDLLPEDLKESFKASENKKSYIAKISKDEVEKLYQKARSHSKFI